MEIFEGIQSPSRIAFNTSGGMIVSERNRRVLGIAERGMNIEFLRPKGTDVDFDYTHPRGIAVTSDDKLLVVDVINRIILQYTIQGQFEKSVSGRGDGSLQLTGPYGIGVHPTGKIVVTDMGGSIQVLNPDLSFSHSFCSAGSSPQQCLFPTDVAFDNQGMVYIVDHNKHQILKFFLNGTFITSFGSKGSKEGRLKRPTAIVIDSQNLLYVTEKGNNRVSVFTNEGKFLVCFGTVSSIPKLHVLNAPDGLAFDNNGRLCVCDTGNNRVVCFPVTQFIPKQ